MLDINGASGVTLAFKPGSAGIDIKGRGGAVEIGYNEVNDAFRGLGLVNAAANPGELDITEQRSVDKTWIMLDASRNRVYTVAAMREWLHFMALSGINGFMLYTEET